MLCWVEIMLSETTEGVLASGHSHSLVDKLGSPEKLQRLKHDHLTTPAGLRFQTRCRVKSGVASQCEGFAEQDGNSFTSVKSLYLSIIQTQIHISTVI